MSDGGAIIARLDDMEKLLSMYQAECQRAKVEFGQRLDRVMSAMLGDRDLGSVGFIEAQRNQHQNLLAQVDRILDAQNESQRHRALNLALPGEVAELRAQVLDLIQEARDDRIRIEAYRKTIHWLWAAIGVAASVWPTVYGLIQVIK